jgi:predicted outer membrane protein
LVAATIRNFGWCQRLCEYLSENQGTPHEKASFLFIALLIAAPAFAQSVGEKSGVNSALGISPTTADFVKQVAISDIFELQSNRLAEERGSAAEKAFAATMIKDHTQDQRRVEGSGQEWGRQVRTTDQP